MTDTELEVETVAEPVVVTPRPVRRPPARAKPSPRKAPVQRAAEKDPVLSKLEQILAAQSDLAARLEVVERGGTRFVESEEAPKPTMREANPQAVSPFTRKLLSHTHDMPEGGVVERERPYNVGLRWYLRRDGDYVQLQGDKANRAMYEDLGFYLLTLDEAKDFETHERPLIVKEQRTRANLINQLRKLARREPALSAYVDDADWDWELEEKSIDGLRQEWRRLCVKIGDPDRELPTERHRAERSNPLLAGIETNQRSMEDFDRIARYDRPKAPPTREIERTQANAHLYATSG